jgi:glyoxylase-like metal-dependent hydrolase (beta-lactamase superfamily II)
MRNALVRLALLSLLPLHGALAGEATETPAACLERVSPSVYALIQGPDMRYQLGNATFVVTDRGAIAVDPPSDREAFDCALSTLREEAGVEVSHVVLTHWHGDHTAGAGYFPSDSSGPVILGSAAIDAAKVEEARKDHADRLAYYREQLPVQAEILRTGVTPSGREITAEERAKLEGWLPSRQRWLANHQEVRFVAPGVTFDGRLGLASSPSVEIHHLAGHTAGDVVVHVPEEGVLIAGDLVDRLPFAGHGSLAGWTASLERLAAFEPRIIVPGHGPLYRGKGQLDRMRRTFLAAADVARAGLARGEAPDEVTAAALMDEHRDLLVNLLIPDAAPAELEELPVMLESVVEAALREAQVEGEAGQPVAGAR